LYFIEFMKKTYLRTGYTAWRPFLNLKIIKVSSIKWNQYWKILGQYLRFIELAAFLNF
jgi:hypothetical protein